MVNTQKFYGNGGRRRYILRRLGEKESTSFDLFITHIVAKQVREQIVKIENPLNKTRPRGQSTN